MNEFELTILMPCLNEEETLEVCIRKAQCFLDNYDVKGEVLIADNGSLDQSVTIAEACGARVVHIEEKGYGAALLGGINSAKGEYVIMGDADDSYDFSNLMPFLNGLRKGNDLVMGNRFAGGIDSGAMPFLHKYVGNPILSFLGRLFFDLKTNDFHCGLRGFKNDRIRDLKLRTTGMEFASELVVRSSIANYSISEVPTRLAKDGRSRPPHLQTWRDGWRHLVFLLLYSPKWLFLYPGLGLMAIGLVAALALLPGTISVGDIDFDIHTLIVACAAVIVGFQSLSFAIIARQFALNANLLPELKNYSNFLQKIRLENVLIFSLIILLAGSIGLIWCTSTWAANDFGPIEYTGLIRVLALSMTAIVIGIQTCLNGFLLAITQTPFRLR